MGMRTLCTDCYYPLALPTLPKYLVIWITFKEVSLGQKDWSWGRSLKKQGCTRAETRQKAQPQHYITKWEECNMPMVAPRLCYHLAKCRIVFHCYLFNNHVLGEAVDSWQDPLYSNHKIWTEQVDSSAPRHLLAGNSYCIYSSWLNYRWDLLF